MSVRRAGVALLAALLLAGCAAAPSGPPPRTAADLTNAQLSPAHSQWLVGAIGQMASEEEVAAYLALADDAAAAAFVESFWAARDGNGERPGNPLRELFEQRQRDADRRFSEAGYLGRRTDRGRIFVLHGEPQQIGFELNPRPGEPPLERWDYAPNAAPGLDRRRPQAVYRFVKSGDLTVLFTLPLADRARLAQPES